MGGPGPGGGRAVAGCGGASQDGRVTAATLLDRILIEDLVTG